MKNHVIGFVLTLIGTAVLGPIGLIGGVVAWVLMAKK